MKEVYGMPEFYDVLLNRRSVRLYQKRSVPWKILQRVLNAGRLAPSAHNAQPWRFLIFQSSTSKSDLAKAMGAKLREDREKDGGSPAVIEKEVQSSISRFSQAPVLIVVNLTMASMDEYPNRHRQQVEYIMAIQSVAAAIQNMLLAAQAEGLAACWFCAPLFCQEAVREVLSLSDEWHPQAIITMGYAAETPQAPERKNLEDIVEYWS